MSDTIRLSSKDFLHDCLLLDIETNEKNEIYAVGAVFQGHKLQFSPKSTITRSQFSEIDALASGAIIKRQVDGLAGKEFSKRRYHILGMKELYLGYAGNFYGNHKIHTALAKCKVGDILIPVVRDENIYLVDSEETPVAKFSKAARNVWLPKIDTVQGVNVIAMVRREMDDKSDKDYTQHCKCEVWEIPVCELVSISTSLKHVNTASLPSHSFQ